ncbi:MAG: O-antigen ligase family protein [Bacillota bacterium]|nr:O-antigen ligase family protein [Bacillota bacterium]
MVGPFFRGLFFPGEQLVALAVVMAVFAGFWVYSALRGYERPRRYLEWAGLALVLTYWAAVLTAVTPRAAVGEALQYTAYLAVLWMLARLGDGQEWRFALSVPLVVAALGVAILGLGAAAGTFSYPGAFEGGRICSSLQYPNTAATYLTAGFILASGLAGWAAGGSGRGGPGSGLGFPRWSGLLGAGALAGSMSVIFLAFVFTLSRGGWLVFPLLLVLLGVLMPRGQRALSLSLLVAALLGGLAAVPGLGRVMSGPGGEAVWMYTTLAFALGGLLGAVARLAVYVAAGLAAPRTGSRAATGSGAVRVTPRVAAAPTAERVVPSAAARPISPAIRTLRRVAVEVVILVMVAGVVLVLARPAAVAALVPRQLRDRLAAISLTESGAQDRVQWTRDALRLVAMRPVLGAGGGGWNALYGTIQTYPYFSTEVHNHYAQVWVEAGTLGFFAFLGVWAGLIWSYWRARQVTGGPAGALLTATFVAAAGLGAHAVLDFNLSLPAVAATLWALFGLVAAAEPVPEPRGRRRATAPWWLAAGVPLVAVAILLLIVSLRVGHAAGQRGAAALNGGNLDRALVEFESARRYDPWTASFSIDLGQIYERMGRQSGAPGLFQKARLSYQRGVGLDRYSFQYHTLYANFLLRQGEIEPALRELETAISCRPALAAGYENLAIACVRAALSPQVDGARARLYLERVAGVAGQMQRYSALAPAFARNRKMPSVTPRMVLARGEALLLRGDLSAACADLQEAAKQKDLKPEASLFLAVWARLAGQDPTPFLRDAASIQDAALEAELIAARARTLASSQ